MGVGPVYSSDLYMQLGIQTEYLQSSKMGLISTTKPAVFLVICIPTFFSSSSWWFVRAKKKYILYENNSSAEKTSDISKELSCTTTEACEDSNVHVDYLHIWIKQ